MKKSTKRIQMKNIYLRKDDGESLYDEYGEWDKGTTYFDTSSSTSTGWYMGQGKDREEHVHEGMQTLDGGFIAIGHHWDFRRRPNWIYRYDHFKN